MTQRGHPLAPRPVEAVRDQEPSEFTPILREIASRVPTVLAAAFVDFEGECIDYFSTLDPFEAKVNAAQTWVLLSAAAQVCQRAGWGETWSLEVLGNQRELLARRVSDEYALVVLRRTDGQAPRLRAAVEQAVDALRREAGVHTPPWEPSPQVLFVETRPAVGWAYAPIAYSEGGARIHVDDVLGRWVEANGAVCFRIHNDRGEELTLVHEPSSARWKLRS